MNLVASSKNVVKAIKKEKDVKNVLIDNLVITLQFNI